MQFMDLYKGFLIEPLVYQTTSNGTLRMRGERLARVYGASVRITDVQSTKSAVSKLPIKPDFDCVGDARRAAEIFGRQLIDRMRTEEELARG